MCMCFSALSAYCPLEITFTLHTSVLIDCSALHSITYLGAFYSFSAFSENVVRATVIVSCQSNKKKEVKKIYLLPFFKIRDFASDFVRCLAPCDIDASAAFKTSFDWGNKTRGLL